MMDQLKDALARKRGMSLDITILMDGEPVGKQMVDLSGQGDATEETMENESELESQENDADGAPMKDKSELAPPGSTPPMKQDVGAAGQAGEMQGMLEGSPKGGLRDKVSAFWDKKKLKS